ncbi:MAG TPA: hypothetical protein VM370_05025 [Candidatus Thermoplasmatota archaeon]|nr:hypothetical protein [Candidatus Thermoplasmatota archaeon]
MRSEKILRLGHVRIDGPDIHFEPERTLAFEAARSDAVSIGVAYEYHEVTDEREETRIRLTALVGEHKPETFEAVIGDSPLRDDSRRGFLSVPIRTGGTSELRGRFRLEVSYASGPWKAATLTPDAHAKAEGEFVVRVR